MSNTTEAPFVPSMEVFSGSEEAGWICVAVSPTSEFNSLTGRQQAAIIMAGLEVYVSKEGNTCCRYLSDDGRTEHIGFLNQGVIADDDIMDHLRNNIPVIPLTAKEIGTQADRLADKLGI